MGIRDSILDTVGGTPLVRLSRLTADLPGEILLKLELNNPGGSHKMRIALNMIRAAEREGLLKPGSGQTILEPTGGNTGMGIAIAAAVLGYRVVLVIPDNYSESKRRLLASFGVDVRLSDSTRGNNSHGELATEIQFEHPEYVMLNQAANPANPEIHRLTDIRQDHRRPGRHPGGRLRGRHRHRRPPDRHRRGAPAAPGRAAHPRGAAAGVRHVRRRVRPHRIQGLSIGMIPPVLNTEIIDEMVTVSEADAIDGMRRLMECEGIGAGPSTGANIAACRRLLAASDEPLTLLTVAYDRVNDYLELL